MDPITIPAISSDRPSFTLIWLHGLGADALDFEDFQQELHQFSDIENVKLILPEAPARTITAAGKEMRGWFDIKEELTEDNLPDDFGGMDASVELVDAIVTAEKAAHPDTPVVLGGFSQGAVIALLAGFEAPERIAGVIALSGFVPEHPRFAEISDVAKSLPVFIGHGMLDPVVPVSVINAGVARLNNVGASVSLRTYPMLHEICPDEMKDLGDFLRDTMPELFREEAA